MPEIAVDISTLEGGFEALPEGTYLAEIQSAVYQEARNAGNFPQMKVTYAVIEGELEGKMQSQWVTLPDPSLSRPFKAGGRLKNFFGKFGLTEGALHFDDETGEFDGMLIDGGFQPVDLQGIRVIIRSFKNGTRQNSNEPRWDISLESVEDSVDGAAAGAPAVAAAPATRAPMARAAAAGQRRTLR